MAMEIYQIPHFFPRTSQLKTLDSLFICLLTSRVTVAGGYPVERKLPNEDAARPDP